MTFDLGLLLIGLVIGYYARTMKALLRGVLHRLGLQIDTMKAQGESGVIRNNTRLVPVERGGKRYVQPENMADKDGNIFRAPNPREVALQNEADKNNRNL